MDSIIFAAASMQLNRNHRGTDQPRGWEFCISKLHETDTPLVQGKNYRGPWPGGNTESEWMRFYSAKPDQSA
jgi:hypothetical protein